MARIKGIDHHNWLFDYLWIFASSEESSEKGPAGQPQARVQPQTQMTAPKQTQTPDQLSEPPEAQVLPLIQPQVLQIQTQPKLHKQAQTQTSPEHLTPQQNQVQSQSPWQPRETDPLKPAQAQTQPQPLWQVQPQKEAQTQTHPQVSAQAQSQEQTSEKTPDQPETWPQGSVPPPEQATVLACATEPRLSCNAAEARGGEQVWTPHLIQLCQALLSLIWHCLVLSED